MQQRQDSFAKFLRQARENWHIVSALALLSFFATVAAADASGAIKDQGSRLATVEIKVNMDSDRIATIEERSRITLDYVKDIDGRLTVLMERKSQ